MTGNIAMPGFTASKLVWVARHEPDVFARMRTVLLPKDYVRLKLTSDKASDVSDSAGTLWLNTQERDWSDEMLELTGLDRSQMPRLCEGSEATGTLRPVLAERWSMSPTTVVAGGGGDNAASGCGVGAVSAGTGFISIGTSGVVFLTSDCYKANPEGAVHTFCNAVPGTRLRQRQADEVSAPQSLGRRIVDADWDRRGVFPPLPRLFSTLMTDTEQRSCRQKVFAVAPMMDWTDRYCRVFHRRLTQRALLYTEMVVADAVLFGDRSRLLGCSEAEHPVALQLGGSNPEKLAEAAKIAEDFGYGEINLNVGCPSDRVQSGTFGACLMREPGLVGECIGAMAAVVDVPVTVKCRIGVDDQDPEAALDDLADAVVAAGAAAIWVHARKAWLSGLSPKENRDVPPLDYDRVYRLKLDRPETFVGINGGIGSIAEAVDHLRRVDGVMLGRAAYQTPALLASVDHELYDKGVPDADLREVVVDFLPVIESWLAEGGRLGPMVRPLLGLFHGCPGARRWRQILATEGHRPDAGVAVIKRALAAVRTDESKSLLDIADHLSEATVSRSVAV